MKIINLIEYTGDYPFLCEHGLSIYVETENHKILVDTGQSNLFIQNAKQLKIDLSLVDLVFISHGHYDHAGGLKSFLEINDKAQIYIHKNAKREFYSFKKDKSHYIGMDSLLYSSPRIHWIDYDFKMDEIYVFGNVAHEKYWPKSNLRLKYKVKDKYIQDSFDHEIYVVIQNKVLLSGCAHNGIVNIMDEFQRRFKKDPEIVISGFHMIQSQYMDEDIQCIQDIAKDLKSRNSNYYTGHCTGEFAYSILKKYLNSQIHYMKTGSSIEIKD